MRRSNPDCPLVLHMGPDRREERSSRGKRFSRRFEYSEQEQLREGPRRQKEARREIGPPRRSRQHVVASRFGKGQNGPTLGGGDFHRDNGRGRLCTGQGGLEGERTVPHSEEVTAAEITVEEGRAQVKEPR